MLLWLWFVPLDWIKRWWVGCGWPWTVCRDAIDVTRIQGRKAVTCAHDGWFKQTGCEIRHSTVGTMPRDVIQCHIHVYWCRHMHAIGVKPLFPVVTSYSSLFPCGCFTVYMSWIFGSSWVWILFSARCIEDQYHCNVTKSMHPTSFDVWICRPIRTSEFHWEMHWEMHHFTFQLRSIDIDLSQKFRNFFFHIKIPFFKSGEIDKTDSTFRAGINIWKNLTSLIHLKDF